MLAQDQDATCASTTRALPGPKNMTRSAETGTPIGIASSSNRIPNDFKHTPDLRLVQPTTQINECKRPVMRRRFAFRVQEGIPGVQQVGTVGRGGFLYGANHHRIWWTYRFDGLHLETDVALGDAVEEGGVRGVADGEVEREVAGPGPEVAGEGDTDVEPEAVAVDCSHSLEDQKGGVENAAEAEESTCGALEHTHTHTG
ncbi:unnamed protein product [Mesocestoides corti]|uniref:Uncharacterized protein n=1 Tax=Mesocestoides corti TaxID=53468 RepID=A0A0R3UI48_MESCO|nr:unnamed protein product [Mesocestoides corti]